MGSSRLSHLRVTATSDRGSSRSLCHLLPPRNHSWHLSVTHPQAITAPSSVPAKPHGRRNRLSAHDSQGRAGNALHDTHMKHSPGLHPLCGDTADGVEIPLPSLRGFGQGTRGTKGLLIGVVPGSQCRSPPSREGFAIERDN